MRVLSCTRFRMLRSSDARWKTSRERAVTIFFSLKFNHSIGSAAYLISVYTACPRIRGKRGIIYLVIITLITPAADWNYLSNVSVKMETMIPQERASGRINSRGIACSRVICPYSPATACYLKNIYPLFENVRSFDSRGMLSFRGDISGVIWDRESRIPRDDRTRNIIEIEFLSLSPSFRSFFPVWIRRYK